jgi:hypothetical protein
MQAENNVFLFLLGWAVMIVLLMLINKTRLGHVAIYYGILLLIFFIIVTEYKQLAPLVSGLKTISQINTQG